jgi:ABC-type multidrug transport system ATPase subunit
MLHVEGVAYLVDSTLGGTEAGFRERCLSLLEEKREAGAAIVYTSRDLDGVERLCDSVLWLERGSFVARGGFDEVAAAVVADQGRLRGPDRLAPTTDAARLLEFLRIAVGDLRADDALLAATSAARDAGETEVGWVGLAAAAGYDVSEAERIVDRLARRAVAGGDEV